VIKHGGWPPGNNVYVRGTLASDPFTDSIAPSARAQMLEAELTPVDELRREINRPTGENLIAGPQQRSSKHRRRRIKVAATERDQRAGGFYYRVRLIRQFLTAGVRQSRCHTTNWCRKSTPGRRALLVPDPRPERIAARRPARLSPAKRCACRAFSRWLVVS
jgi:hypothetical protein